MDRDSEPKILEGLSFEEFEDSLWAIFLALKKERPKLLKHLGRDKVRVINVALDVYLRVKPGSLGDITFLRAFAQAIFRLCYIVGPVKEVTSGGIPNCEPIACLQQAWAWEQYAQSMEFAFLFGEDRDLENLTLADRTSLLAQLQKTEKGREFLKTEEGQDFLCTVAQFSPA